MAGQENFKAVIKVHLEQRAKTDKQMNTIGKLLYPHLESIVQMFQENKSEDIKQNLLN